MIHALIPYVLLTLGLSASLALFVSLKRDLRSAAIRDSRKMEAIARRIEETPAPREAEVVYIPAAPRPGMNVSKRVQAMRMVRRKEDVSRIAAALGVPRREVELLIRVQTMPRASGSAH